MQNVTIFTTLMCPYCHRAKALLHQKGVVFEEIDVTMRAGKRAEMSQRAGGRTSVPQIFVGDHHIGGSDDLQALEDLGELDALLQIEPQG